jgi:hypothetical protein
VSRRTLVLVGLLVAVVLAGGVSYFASSSPDGLNKVASDTGFDKGTKAHHLEDSPFSGYQTKGAGDGFLSGGLAGVAGVGVTFLIVGGIVWAVRRRSSSVRPADADSAHSADSTDSNDDDRPARDGTAEESVRR